MTEQRTKQHVVKDIKDVCSSITATTNYLATRSSLSTLIQELLAITNYQHPTTYPIELVKGGWRQLWTDQYYPIPSIISLDQKRIFQYVSDSGYYWNLSDAKLLNLDLIVSSGYLRGKYQQSVDQNGNPNGPTVNVEFTKSGFNLFKLPKADIDSFTKSVENNTYLIFPFNFSPPNGPIGVQGALTSIYVDDDLRIDAGAQFNYFNTAGQLIQPGFSGTLFVLERVRNI